MTRLFPYLLFICISTTTFHPKVQSCTTDAECQLKVANSWCNNKVNICYCKRGFAKVIPPAANSNDKEDFANFTCHSYDCKTEVGKKICERWPTHICLDGECTCTRGYDEVDDDMEWDDYENIGSGLPHCDAMSCFDDRQCDYEVPGALCDPFERKCQCPNRDVPLYAGCPRPLDLNTILTLVFAVLLLLAAAVMATDVGFLCCQLRKLQKEAALKKVK